jgi:hypothetical protein
MLDREKDGIYTTTIRGVVVGALTRAQVANAVACYECSAPLGAVCRATDKPHASRRKEAMKLYGLIPPQAVLDNKSIDGWYIKFREYAKDPDLYNARKRQRERRRAQRKPVPATPAATRFECPICGGPHVRAEHPPARRTGVIKIKRPV